MNIDPTPIRTNSSEPQRTATRTYKVNLVDHRDNTIDLDLANGRKLVYPTCSR